MTPRLGLPGDGSLEFWCDLLRRLREFSSEPADVSSAGSEGQQLLVPFVCVTVFGWGARAPPLFVCSGSSLPGARPPGKHLISGLTEEALTGSPGGASTPLPSVMPRLSIRTSSLSPLSDLHPSSSSSSSLRSPRED